MTKDNLVELISPTSTLRDAMLAIECGESKIAVVVDEASRLLGTVTDGDIRRGILRGLDVSDPVSGVMNSQPCTARENEPRHVVVSRMLSEHLRQIPVVDSENRIVRIEFVFERNKAPAMDNLVVLMAGGEGRRLRPMTADIPKPMLPVGEKPILETIIGHFAAAGFRKFLLSVNYKAKHIESHFGDGSQLGVHIDYLQEDAPMGTAGALGLISERPELPFFVMNGDILTNIDPTEILNYHREYAAMATLCVRQSNFQVPYGVVEFDDNLVLSNIYEKPVQNYFANAGIYVLQPEALDRIPSKSSLDMPQLMQGLVDSGDRCAVYPIHEYWVDIGHMRDYEQANRDFPIVFR